MKPYDIETAKRQLLRYEGPLAIYFREQEERLIFGGIDLSNKVVLDLGCGIGRLEKLLPATGVKHIVACDLAEPMLRVAATWAPHQNVIYTVMDAGQLALPNQSVDVVMSLGMFEGIADIRPFVREVYRVLRPGGIFIFTCWNSNRWYRFRFLDGRRQGSVDHHEMQLSALLQDESFQMKFCDSFLFLPRRFFWGVYHALMFNSLRMAYVSACNWGANHIRRSALFRKKGWVLIIKAYKL